MLRYITIPVLILLSTFTNAHAENLPQSKLHMRIVGGQEATRGEYPFMVALLRSNITSIFQAQICGGTIISSQYVMTAAHCVTNDSGVAYPPSSYDIGLGYFDLDNDVGERVKVKSIHVHPNYKQGASDANDVAVLELETATNRPKITLVSDDSETPVGANSTAIGWGLTDFSDSNSYVSILREVQVPIVSNSVCAASYGSDLNDTMLCAGLAEGGKDACSGDSGGPLLVGTDGAWQQAGIVSFGTGCAWPNYYGVYSKIAALRSFIDPYLDVDIPIDDGSKSIKYGLWNGFLGMINVIELVNSTAQKEEVKIYVYTIDGNLASTNSITLNANSQMDIIANSLTGFQSDSYGVIKIESNISSRVSSYRPTDTTFTDFEYTFGVDVSNPLAGTSYVDFNTYQPSLKGTDANNLVANWLSVVNLSTTKKKFVVTKYSINGTKLDPTSTIEVAPLGRRDIEGGHVNPGPANVGLIEITPEDQTAPYLSQLMRYGYSSNGGFDFAFPLIASSGSSSAIYLPAGSEFSEQNWLEVANSSSSQTSAQILFYDSTGTLVGAPVKLSLSAHSQQHLNVTSILPANHIGSITIEPDGSEKIIAQSMHYFYNTDSSIAAMHGTQGESGTTTVRTGSYNLYLGMENYLNITNLSDSASSYDLLISSSAAQGSSTTFSLNGHETVNLHLHDTSTYGTAANTYGTVSLTSKSGANTISQIVRVHYDSNREVEFASPTSMLLSADVTE